MPKFRAYAAPTPVVVCLAFVSTTLGISTAAWSQNSARLVRERSFEVADGLTRISSLTADENGSLYVGQPQDGVVLVFAPDGSLQRRIGRRGGGPGEFESVNSLGWIGHRLWVWDAGLRRASVFERDGRFVRGWGSDSLRLQFTPYGFRADGRMLGQRPALGRRIADGTLPDLPLLVLDAAGMAVDTVAPIMMANSVLQVRLERSSSVLNQPVDDNDLFAVSADGGTVAVVERAVERIAPRGGYVLRLIRVGSGTVWTRRRQGSAIPLPRSSLDSVLEARIQTLASTPGLGADAAALRAVVRREAYAPEFLPGATRVLIAGTGEIWVRGPTLGQSLSTWDVWSADGSSFRSFSAPPGLTLMAARGDLAWGVSYDADGAPELASYRLR